MADLDDEAVIVTLPAEGDGTVITKIEGDQPVKKVDPENSDPLEDLKGQFAHMTQRATAAEAAQRQATQRVTEVETELQTTRASVTESQLDTVLSGIQAAESDATAAEAAYVAAAEAGDFAAQARAQRKMSAAEARIQRLTEAKGDLEDIKATKPAARQEPRQQPQQRTADPVESFASQMTPKSAAWIRSHPDCVTDSRKNARMLAAHNMAVADDIEVESPEYFRRIEEAVMPKSPVTKVDDPAGKVEPSGKRPSSAAAPGGGSGGGMNGGGGEVRLTQREVQSATDGSLVWNYSDPKGKFKKDEPIGVQEFARRKMIMQKQGLYDRSLSE